MKRLLVLILALMVIIYALPLITVGSKSEYWPDDDILASGTSAPPQTTEQEDATEPAEAQPISYDATTTISVYADGELLEMSLHDYLCGVIAAEMPASFPEEALKAQCVAARSYTLYKIMLIEGGQDIPASHNGAQFCADPAHCKAYTDIAANAASLWGEDADYYTDRIKKCVLATDGIIATYKGEPIAAVFHAASNAKTERAADVWGADLPYLQSVDSPGGDACKSYYGQVTISAEEFVRRFTAAYPDAEFGDDPKTWFKASARSEAGGIIDVAVGGVRVEGTVIRSMLGLNSTNFRYSVDGQILTFETTGYGHGVGLSQYGARQLALEGKTYGQIIHWYYIDVDLTLKSA